MPKPAFAVLYGEPGCGKTFVALSMALQIANGQPWLGREVRQGEVVYIAAEGVLGLKLRIAAHRERYGVDPDRMRFIAEAINVMEARESMELVKRLNEQENASPLGSGSARSWRARRCAEAHRCGDHRDLEARGVRPGSVTVLRSILDRRQVWIAAACP